MAAGAIALRDVVCLVVAGSRLAVDVVERALADRAHSSSAGPLQYAGETEDVPAPGHGGFIVDSVLADRAHEVLRGIQRRGLGHLAGAGSRGGGAIFHQVFLRRHLAPQTTEMIKLVTCPGDSPQAAATPCKPRAEELPAMPGGCARAAASARDDPGAEG